MTELSYSSSSASRHPTMAEVAARELRAAILTGRFAPGEPLRLEPVAEMLGMSVSPVREAVRRLEQLGFVAHAPRRGSRVSRLSAEELADVLEVRLALETVAVRRAATRFSDDDSARAETALGRLEHSYDAGDALGVLAGNKAFHLGLYRASGSEFLLRQIESTWDNCDRYRAWLFSGDSFVSVRDLEREGHERILEACRAHDSDGGVRALEDHLSLFSRLVHWRLAVPDAHEGELLGIPAVWRQ